MRRKAVLPQRLLLALPLGAGILATALAAAPSVVDLHLALADSPDPVQRGAILTYDVTVTNRGTSPATGVQLVERLPDRLRVESATASQGTCNTMAPVSCALGTLDPQSFATVRIRVRPRVSGRLESAVTTTAAETDADPADDSATAVTTVVDVTVPPKKPEPRPKPPEVTSAVCIVVNVSPMSFPVGRRVTVEVVATAAGRPVVGARVVVRGKALHAVGRSNGRGIARVRLGPTRPGLLVVTLPGRNTCRGAQRIGVTAPSPLPRVTG